MDVNIIKAYKNLSEKRIPNINEVYYSLSIVERFIKKHSLILYGGMAIDMSLKNSGHEGIYTEDTMPDYDFYSPNNITDSLLLARELYEEFLEGCGSINAMHLTTRRVRINQSTYVADLSYYPRPYYDNIPTTIYNGFRIVHSDFQRIDLHRSLSYLYEGAPVRENYKNRLSKDIKRLNLLFDNCPISNHKIKPIKSTKLLIGQFDIERSNSKFTNPGGAIGGCLALQIMCQLADIKPPFKKLIDYIEIWIDKIPEGKYEYYEKTCDIYPEAAVDHDNKIIYYYNYGERIAATDCGEWGYICNIHVLCSTFLFKYFMLGNKSYLDCYNMCIHLIEQQPNNKYLNRLLNICGDYYGQYSIYLPALYNDKIDNCLLEDKSYAPRPQLGFQPNKKIDTIIPENYITYQIGGRLTDKIIDKSNKCPL